MSRHTNIYADGSELAGIDDVLLVLQRLEHDLPLTHLPMLGHFNRTYLIITRNVRQHLRKGGFEHPDFLQRFDARFAHYYLHALQQYLRQEPVPRAWQHAFETAQRRGASPLVCMALGVNAHVNNDIPQVLRDCQATDEHFDDYVQVNDIIRRSLHEVMDQFRQDDRLLSPHRSVLRPLYAIGMEELVKIWRRSAWLKFKRLSGEDLSINSIEAMADRMAKGIYKLPM